MKVPPLTASLPKLGEDDYVRKLRERLAESLEDNARIVRELQCPPTFRAVPTATTSLTATVFAKIVLGTVQWDTHGYWVAASDRFMPTDFSGYWRVTGKVSFPAMTVTSAGRRTSIYKNGSEYSSAALPAISTYRTIVVVSDLVYLNGATDYVELFARSGDACDIETETYYTSLAIDFVGADQLA